VNPVDCGTDGNHPQGPPDSDGVTSCQCGTWRVYPPGPPPQLDATPAADTPEPAWTSS
jgi:hypothetical protein